MSSRKSHTVAFCGLMGALMLTIMLVGNLLAIATFCAPLFAGLLLIPVMEEKGEKMAWVLYLAVSLLALMLVADPELSFTFVFLVGPYPMLRRRLSKLRLRGVRVALKAVYFNVMLLIMYRILLALFPILGDMGELGGSRELMIASLILLGNVVFLFYDQLVARFTVLYLYRLRPRLKHFL